MSGPSARTRREPGPGAFEAMRAARAGTGASDGTGAGASDGTGSGASDGTGSGASDGTGGVRQHHDQPSASLELLSERLSSLGYPPRPGEGPASGDLAFYRDRPIGSLTTYRVGGSAALFAEVASIQALRTLASALDGVGIPVLVLGNGSNLLVADEGFPGVCVRLGGALGAIEIVGSSVRAGAAASYPVVARRSAAAGLEGMEWAVGIPGTVGGAVRMNAGGHGSQTADRLEYCAVFDLRTGLERRVSASELGLSYRGSALGGSEVVVEGAFRLSTGSAEVSTARIGEIVRWRRANQPGGQNAGSVFVNPPGDAAGRLVEAAGLKGLRIGTAAVSDKHANFVQADPGGRAADVRRVIEAVREGVAAHCGTVLETELRLIGFEESL